MPSSKVLEKAIQAIESNGSMQLDLVVKGRKLTRGEFVPRADAQSAPALHFPGARPDQTYVVVNIDPDAPFASMPFLGPILHWVQPGLQATAEDNGLSIASGEPHIANYAGPGPPPLSAPHRYIFLLYEQPATWDAARAALAGVKPGADVGHGPRMRFDLDGWIAQAGLGEPVAGNWFVSN